MGIRQEIASHPRLAGVLAGLCLLVLTVSAVTSFNRTGRPNLPRIPGKSFYTVDEGATVFTDSLWQNPPFEHEGREAVRAFVFSCDGGMRKWVQYLEKWSAEDRKLIELAKHLPPGAAKMPDERRLLVKRPGSREWVARSSPAAVDIVKPRCPDETGTGTPASVLP